MTSYRKKLIEVALPLEAINVASAREKSIRHGHPSTLHPWWARRPLAACRAVLFSQLVDDPSSWPEHFQGEERQAKERKRLFDLITDLVQWKNSNNDRIINAARVEIARSLARERKADGEGNQRDDAVLQVPTGFTGTGYRNLVPHEVKIINSYLAEVAPPVHDPFAGGGSIPLEAQRLGLRAIATDLNPVAVLINKALIEIPPQFAGLPPVNPESRKSAGMRTWKGAQGLAEDIRYYGKWVRDEAYKRIGHLYPPVKVTEEMQKERPDLKPYLGKELKVIAWLWARTVPSPNPACGGAKVPLVSSFWLSKKAGREAYVEPVVDTKSMYWRFKVCAGRPLDSRAVSSGTKSGRGSFRCLLSGEPIPNQYIRKEAQAGRLKSTMMAIVLQGDRSRHYVSPIESQAETAVQVVPQWGPEELVTTPSHDVDRLPMYGMRRWGDAFTARQLAMLTTFGEIASARELPINDEPTIGVILDRSDNSLNDWKRAHVKAISTYLALAVSKMTASHNVFARWRAGEGKSAPAFGRQAIPMVWDYAEVNPFAGAGGDFAGIVDGACRVVASIPASPVGTAFQRTASSANPNPSSLGSVVSTDPPYYDNICYGDLSDFFYVWLRKSLRDVWPSLFTTMLVPKSEEMVAASHRFGGNKQAAKEHFEDGFRESFVGMRASISAAAPLTVYYAFKQAETSASADGVEPGSTASTGWETMLSAMLSSGFSVTGTWPSRTEGGTRLVAMGTNSLSTSVVLVCRKRFDEAPTIDRSEFRRLLRRELPAALRHLQRGNIAPVDMAQASIGPGIAMFSRHAKVLEPDGSQMIVRTALQLINQALDEYLAEQEGEFDSDTRFALTWFESNKFDSGPFGVAETLAKARNVSVRGVEEAGILTSSAGKVRILRRGELPEDWDPEADKRLTVWEATQHLIKRLETQGEEAAAELLGKLGTTAAAARDLAYRLYTTCERKGWAEEARAYNGLVVSWPELEKLATGLAKKPKAGMLL
jgi:putative DNA methylase